MSSTKKKQEYYLYESLSTCWRVYITPQSVFSPYDQFVQHPVPNCASTSVFLLPAYGLVAMPTSLAGVSAL
jgi:hypothetical protein